MIAVPGDFPLSLTTNPVVITLVVLGLLSGLLIGIVLLAGGRRFDLDGATRRFEEESKQPWFQNVEKHWRKRLSPWRVIHQHLDATLLREIITTWDLLESGSRFMLGLCLVVFAPIDLLVLLLSKGAIMRNLPALLVMGSLLSLGMLLGHFVTYTIGYRQVRQAMRNRVTYADLRERRLSDYRSPLFRWLLGLITGVNWLLLLVLPAFPGFAMLAPPLWARLIVCGMLMLMFILGEICMASAVALPRLVVTSDPAVARSADDALRGLLIASLQGDVFQFISSLIYLQWFFFLAWLLSSPLLLATMIVATLLWLVGQVLGAIGLLDGRLGGNRMGWRWQKGETV